jgi:hypothetical protein
MRQSSPTLSALQGSSKTLTQGCSNPGLKLANAFGVIQTDARTRYSRCASGAIQDALAANQDALAAQFKMQYQRDSS